VFRTRRSPDNAERATKAGLVGSTLVDRLLSEGWDVTAVDSFFPFYPRAIKEAHLAKAGEIVGPGDRWSGSRSVPWLCRCYRPSPSGPTRAL
jgi:hypothetical protein